MLSNKFYTVKENTKLNEKYLTFKHESGLNIYVFPKNHTTSYALFSTKFGSIDNVFKVNEEKEFTKVPDGIAHFLEHKLFEEENGEDAFVRYAKTGAKANAFTSFEKTAYLFSCTDNFYESLEILLDFVTHPFFSEETVKKEQGIIGQEIKMYEDNPGWQGFFNMLDALYKTHSVKIDIAGTIDTISQITPEILYKCYNTFYNLHNMVLCISGDVDIEKIKQVADKTLKKSEKIKIFKEPRIEAVGISKKIIEKNLIVSEPQFSIGIKVLKFDEDCKINAKNGYIVNIVNEMIFGGASEFYKKYYEQGIINNKFSVGFDESYDFAFISISGESKNPLEVYEKIKEELNNYKKNGFDREEFEICKRVIYSEFISIFENTSSIANTFTACHFNGYDIFDLPDIIASIKFEDLNSLFCEIYTEENMVISIINPII